MTQTMKADVNQPGYYISKFDLYRGQKKYFKKKHKTIRTFERG